MILNTGLNMTQEEAIKSVMGFLLVKKQTNKNPKKQKEKINMT